MELPKTSPLTVLLIDEDPELRAMTAILLERRGAVVVTARCLADAEVIARTRRFDVALADIGAEEARVAINAIMGWTELPGRIVLTTSTAEGAEGLDDLDVKLLVAPFAFDRLVRELGLSPDVATKAESREDLAVYAPVRRGSRARLVH